MILKRHFWIVTILISCCPFFVGAQTGQNNWEKLNLVSTNIEGATIYYERSFEANLPFFEKKYKEFLVEKGKVNAVISKKDQVFADINSILGIDEPDTEMNNKVFTGSLSLFSVEITTFYLVKQSIIKDFLRDGGELANFTYDKDSDMVEYNPNIKVSGKDGPGKNIEFAIPIASDDTFEKDVSMVFQFLQDSFGRVGLSLAIHETAEMAIVKQLSSGDPYKRWFTDGFANAITYEILLRNYSEEMADEFIANYSTELYKELENQLNLKYWMSAEFVIIQKWPLKEENEFDYARYCFATQEAKELTDVYGIEIIKKIIAEYKNLENKSDGSIYSVIQKVTEEDLRKKFEKYQNFQSREEGYGNYEMQYEQAMQNKDAKMMIFSMLRLLELCEQPFSQNSLNWRKNIATLFYLTGEKELANQLIIEFADFMMLSSDPQNQFVGRQLVVFYALGINDPKVAYNYARQTFEENPGEIHAMAIVMHQLSEENNIQKARELAQKICKMVPDDKDPCYQMAKQILSKTEIK